MAIASRRDVVLITVAAVALVGAVAVFWTSGAGSSTNPDFPEGHPYICADCGYVTVLSDDELFRLKREARESESLEPGRVVCPECGSKNTLLAVKCPNCGEYFPRPGRGRPVCPYCKEPFPSLFDD